MRTHSGWDQVWAESRFEESHVFSLSILKMFCSSSGETCPVSSGTNNRIYTYYLRVSKSLVHRKHKPFSLAAVNFFLVLPPGQYLL